MMLRLIGLVGYKQSGKDTVADRLGAYFKGRRISLNRIAFADKLKDEVCEKIGCTREFLDKNKPAFREYLQAYGSEAKKQRGEMVWINEASKKIDPAITSVNIITDVRFPFEAAWIRELGGVLIKIERFEGTTDTHESEQGVDKISLIDYRIPNKGTLQDLEREVYWIYGFLLERWKMK